jgi:dolichyl-phosphate beta-glucosyltransferase
MQPALSIVIPAFNEEARLPPYLRSVLAYLERRDGPWEVIVVDDGSRDRTAAIVCDLARPSPLLRLIALRHNRGKGFAVRTGMLAATGSLRLFCDADGATPILELSRLEQAIATGADIAIGSRAISQADCRVEATLHRKILGTVYNALVRMLAVRGIRDTQCGFKLFTAPVADRLFRAQRLAGFGFDVELLFLAQRWGYDIREVPVNWHERPGGKVRLLRDSARMLGDLFRVRWYWAVGAYQRIDDRRVFGVEHTSAETGDRRPDS